MKVFISYTREDLEIAKRLRNDLEKAGIKTWLDKEDLLPGQSWKTVIIKEIKESSHFIALLSSKALSRAGFVQKELKTALEFLDLLPSGRTFVIPARLDECEPADEKLRDIHWADLFPSYEDGLKKILRSLAPTSQPVNIPEKPVEPAPSIKAEPKENPVPPPQVRESKYQLRKEPMTVSDQEGIKVFGLNEYWRPLEYVENDFRDNGDGSITDRATGLMWQKSGSPNQMYYKRVPAYIKKLNEKRFAGFEDWRLPTVDELKSLLTKEKLSDDLHINPIFDKKQRWCWASDTRASGGGCYVYFNDGPVNWHYDFDYYVRAVRSEQ